ncbi:MAG: CHASE domain-containing protein [Candidatus Omnitrophota bacterium]
MPKNGKYGILSQPNKKIGPMVLIYFALIIITVAVYFYGSRIEQSQIEGEFKLEVSSVISSIEKEKSSNFTFVRSIESFYKSSEFVTREEFKQFCSHGLLRHSNVRAVEWIPRVRLAEREKYESAAIADGFLDFRIRESLGEGLLAPAIEKKEYFPVYYIEPYEGNERVLGFDVSSNAKRVEALSKARYTGMMTATSEVDLIQDAGGKNAFLLFIPVFKSEVTAKTVNDRYDSLYGFIRATFIVEAMIRNALSYLDERGLEDDILVRIYDTTEPSQKNCLYNCPHDDTVARVRPKHVFTTSDRIEVADRVWEVECLATPRFIAKRKSQLPIVILLAGLIFSGLLISYLVASQKRAAYIEKLAGELSKEVAYHKEAEKIIARDKDTLERLVQERTKELLSAQEELVRAKRLSDIGTLAATVAHELRNPLAAIQMAAYNIKRKRENAQLDKHISNIEKKISESNQIINNLLGYSRIKMPRLDKVDVHHILNECALLITARFEGQKIRILKEYGAGKEGVIMADPLQLKEIFTNILGNAYQSTKKEEAAINIETRLISCDRIGITITDNGSGIDKEDIDKVFDPFFTKRSKGTGLGLTISKELINLHGGTIRIKSKKDIGTVVSVVLPIKGKKSQPKIEEGEHV